MVPSERQPSRHPTPRKDRVMDTCETCKFWEPNTKANVLGWCSENDINKAAAQAMLEPGLYMSMCVPYVHTCGEHTPKAPS